LEDVNFEVNAGDRVGIIGRNGAGKSTLLKILSRIVEPTKEELHSKEESQVCWKWELVFIRNFPEGKIFFSRIHSRNVKSGNQKRFDEIVAFSEVEKFLDTPVKRYSSGMYVRSRLLLPRISILKF